MSCDVPHESYFSISVLLLSAHFLVLHMKLKCQKKKKTQKEEIKQFWEQENFQFQMFHLNEAIVSICCCEQSESLFIMYCSQCVLNCSQIFLVFFSISDLFHMDGWFDEIIDN